MTTPGTVVSAAQAVGVNGTVDGWVARRRAIRTFGRARWILTCEGRNAICVHHINAFELPSIHGILKAAPCGGRRHGFRSMEGSVESVDAGDGHDLEIARRSRA